MRGQWPMDPDDRIRRRGDNMMQRSRNRLIIGAASLLAAVMAGRRRARSALAQVTTPEPNLVAPPPGTNEAKAEEAPASSLTTPSLTGPLSREPGPDFRSIPAVPAREGIFRRCDQRHGDAPEQSGPRQSHRDRGCSQRPGLAAEQRGTVPVLRDGRRLFVPDPRHAVFPSPKDHRRHVRAGSGGLRQAGRDRRDCRCNSANCRP